MTPACGPIRVLLVDDHPLFRLGLAAAVRQMEGVELVGEVERAADVVDAVVAHLPDVVLLDLHLPDGSGLEVNRRLAELHPAVHVVILTMSEDNQNLLTALHDGARGYLLKGAGPDRVERAIKTVAAGDVVLAPELAPALVELAQLRGPAPGTPFPQLTPRELDILDLVAAGLDNLTIARRLVLNPKTVRNHVSLVLAKIHAPDRPSAIVQARQAGLGQST
jgi:DNA-binding NarL/FixJ family response regulator